VNKLLVSFALSVLLAFAQGADSLEQLRQEVAANPTSSLAHFKIAGILMRDRNFQEAEREFEAALQGDLQPSWIRNETYLQLGLVFDLIGQPDRAAEAYQATYNPPRANAEVAQMTEPEYSEEARIAGLEGSVQVAGLTDAKGSIRNPRVTRSLGLGLDEKAIEAVRQWRFRSSDGGKLGELPVSLQIDFRLPEKQSRWHMIGLSFDPPAGVTRPMFAAATYPLGTGISVSAIDEGRILGAVGRQATATLRFDIDEDGTPVHFEVQQASLEMWGPEAMALVSEWRFKPGMKNGRAVKVPVTVELAWGPRDLSPAAIANLRQQDLSREPAPNDVVSRPRVIQMGPAEYPEQARAAGLHGTVVIGLVVDENGIPGHFHVVRSLDPLLDQKAIEAVTQWRFAPVVVNGRAVAAPTTVGIPFGAAFKRIPPRD
jgi:TonB family protein